jgi:hypothetical protein
MCAGERVLTSQSNAPLAGRWGCPPHLRPR